MLSTSVSSSSSVFLSTASTPDGDKGATVQDGAGSTGFGELLAALTPETGDKTASAAGEASIPSIVDPALAGLVPPAMPYAAGGNTLPLPLPLLPPLGAGSAAQGATPAKPSQAREGDGPTLQPGLPAGAPLAGEIIPAQMLAAAQASAEPPTEAAPARVPTMPPPHAALKVPSAPEAAGTAAALAQNGQRSVTLTVKAPGETSASPPTTLAEIAPAERLPSLINPVMARKAAHAPALAEAVLPTPTPVTPTLAGSAQPEAFTTSVAQVASAAAPQPVELAAVLDRLVAAREALMPAEATLDIHHAEFGQMSIRFEQSTQGMLSVELAGADPDLQRVVTAASATERSPATHSESSNARGDSGGQRGAAADRESSSSSGREAQSRNERETAQRRAPSGTRAEQDAKPSRSGVFA